MADPRSPTDARRRQGAWHLSVLQVQVRTSALARVSSSGAFCPLLLKLEALCGSRAVGRWTRSFGGGVERVEAGGAATFLNLFGGGGT
jgi:hypothetical protein